LNEKTGGSRSDGIAGIAGGDGRSETSPGDQGQNSDSKGGQANPKVIEKGKDKEQASESVNNDSKSNSNLDSNNSNNNIETSKDSVLKKSNIRS